MRYSFHILHIISVFIFEISAKVQHSQSVSEYKLEFLSTIVFISKKISLKIDLRHYSWVPLIKMCYILLRTYVYIQKESIAV